MRTQELTKKYNSNVLRNQTTLNESEYIWVSFPTPTPTGCSTASALTPARCQHLLCGANGNSKILVNRVNLAVLVILVILVIFGEFGK